MIMVIAQSLVCILIPSFKLILIVEIERFVDGDQFSSFALLPLSIYLRLLLLLLVVIFCNNFFIVMCLHDAVGILMAVAVTDAVMNTHIDINVKVTQIEIGDTGLLLFLIGVIDIPGCVTLKPVLKFALASQSYLLFFSTLLLLLLPYSYFVLFHS
jgi:hypothetical protein